MASYPNTQQEIDEAAAKEQAIYASWEHEQQPPAISTEDEE